MHISRSPVIDPPVEGQPVWETRIVTRGYELNRAGVVSAATILRYCEHARWDSLKEDAALTRMFFERDHFLVVRAQSAEVRETPGFNTPLTLRLWLGGVGRTSLVFAQEVVNTATGRTVARVRVTAVHVGSNGRPEPIPEHWRRNATPLPSNGHKDRWSTPSEAEAHRTIVPVRLSDVDLLRHVNHAAYLDIAEDAATRAMATYWFHDGTPGPYPTCHIQDVTIDYEDQAVFGDDLEVLTWLQDEPCRGAPCTEGCGWLSHILRHSDGKILCRVKAHTAA